MGKSGRQWDTAHPNALIKATFKKHHHNHDYDFSIILRYKSNKYYYKKSKA